jgi:hypothetical protein
MPRLIATLPGAESIWSILDSAPADAQALDFAEPTLFLGFGDPVEEVVADLHQAAALGRVGAQEGTADRVRSARARG